MIRSIYPYLALTALLGAAAWALSFGALPPADFTFGNGTEIESIDPAVVTGQPEGRIIQAIYEGLVNYDPRTLEPTPGVADNFQQVLVRNPEGKEEPKWEFQGISADGLTYTFHIRDTARWSDGSPLTAHDFVYSFRRFLDPMTAAKYVYQLTSYVEGSERYYSPWSLKAGDPVEIELLPERDLLGIRGQVLRGRTFVERLNQDGTPATPPPADDDSNERKKYIFVVDYQGKQEQYLTGGYASDSTPERRSVRQVLLDFGEVGIKAPDDHTLVIQLKNRTPYFLNLMGFYPLFPVHERSIETHGYPAWTRTENLVTNGAFFLHERRLRDRIRLAKNPHYWDRDNVRLNTIDALAIESYVTMLNMYEAGYVDWIPNVPATSVTALLAQNREDFRPSPELTNYFYRINVTRPPLDNPLVRQALSLALNRQEIINTITQAGEVPAYSLVPPGLVNYEQATTVEYNPERAKELLAEAGFPGGRGFRRLEILYNNSEDHAAVAEMILQQWRTHLGIDVRLRNEEWGSYLKSQDQLRFDVCRAGWVGDYLDPNTFLDLFVSDGPNNQTGWRNERYTQLVNDAAAGLSVLQVDNISILTGIAGPIAIPTRMQMLHQAETILMEELPIIPVYFRVTKNMVRPYVHGFYENLQDIHPLRAIWVDQEAKQKFWKERGR